MKTPSFCSAVVCATLSLVCLSLSTTVHASDLTVDNLTVNSTSQFAGGQVHINTAGQLGIGILPSLFDLEFPAGKTIGSASGVFNIQAGDGGNAVPGTLSLLASDVWGGGSGVRLTMDGVHGQVSMDNDDGDSFAFGDNDNHIYANHTDLTLTCENTIRLVSENPLVIHGYTSQVDTITFNGDDGSASFANGQAQIQANGVYVGNGAGLLIPQLGDLSMGSFTSGNQP